ncbi:MAG: DUF4251 domain-containing protein [Candidatus Cryptobacteroides sp.]
MNSKPFLLILLLTISLSAASQTQKRIYTKAELKNGQSLELERRIEQVQDSLRAVEALASLENLDFVVEANKIVFRRGETAYVNSATNFISLSDDLAVIQVAPYNGGGPNGVGGITVEGKASDIVMKTDRKGNVTLSMEVFGTGVSATVSISLPKGSYRAVVTVNPNLHSNRVTLHGILMPSSCSSIFKGRAL